MDASPSLTFNFDKVVRKQAFYGLDKISLNNSSQDPTRLNEVFARELFAAAGVPVPRATFARVTFNGRDLGLYVLTEGFEKRFLGRYFKRTDGSFYEGGLLSDITDSLQVLSGKDADADDSVQRLVRAARETDPVQRFRAIATVLDVDRFISMVAIETMLCHSDSYSMNKNNYRLYHDPESDKIVFMPHGMDRILGAHRSALDLSLVPPRLGLVARALLSTPEGRRLYIDRVSVLVGTLFQPARCAAVPVTWPFAAARAETPLRFVRSSPREPTTAPSCLPCGANWTRMFRMEFPDPVFSLDSTRFKQ